jgi:anti-sigma factor RsiW
MIVFIRDAFRVLAKPCSAHSLHLSKRMDGQLTAGERAGLWVHLCGCASCRAFNRQLRRMRDLLRAQAAPEPQAMPVAVRERLSATLTQNPLNPRDTL